MPKTTDTLNCGRAAQSVQLDKSDPDAKRLTHKDERNRARAMERNAMKGLDMT